MVSIPECLRGVCMSLEGLCLVPSEAHAPLFSVPGVDSGNALSFRISSSLDSSSEKFVQVSQVGRLMEIHIYPPFFSSHISAWDNITSSSYLYFVPCDDRLGLVLGRLIIPISRRLLSPGCRGRKEDRPTSPAPGTKVPGKRHPPPVAAVSTRRGQARRLVAVAVAAGPPVSVARAVQATAAAPNQQHLELTAPVLPLLVAGPWRRGRKGRMRTLLLGPAALLPPRRRRRPEHRAVDWTSSRHSGSNSLTVNVPGG